MESLEKSVYNKLSKRTTIYYSHAYCSWEGEAMKIIINLLENL